MVPVENMAVRKVPQCDMDDMFLFLEAAYVNYEYDMLTCLRRPSNEQTRNIASINVHTKLMTPRHILYLDFIQNILSLQNLKIVYKKRFKYLNFFYFKVKV